LPTRLAEEQKNGEAPSMLITRGLEGVMRIDASAVTVGTFDGVHLGHRALLQRTVAEARRLDVESVALTFEHPPLTVLSPERAMGCLTTAEEKEQAIFRQGLDVLVIVEFTRQLAEMTAAEFAEDVLVGVLSAKCVVCGPSHRFGRDRVGGIDTIRELGDHLGFEVRCVEPECLEGQPVSSTRIRKAIIEGDVASAARMLTHPYRVCGSVLGGDNRGRELGFPTANLRPESGRVLPPPGVYACRVGDRMAAVYVGSAPTFDEGRESLIECHILDFAGDLYGQALAVDFIERLRGDKCFDGREELVAQIRRDIANAREVLGR
jgi:riboflavin kinase/FMN adenylyltransferase